MAPALITLLILSGFLQVENLGSRGLTATNQVKPTQVEVVQEDPPPTGDEPLTVQVPYNVDLEAFSEATSTSAFLGEYQRPLDPGGEGTIEAANFEHPVIAPVVIGKIFDAEGNIIAKDLLVEGVKESFDFTVENAARADVLFSLVFGGFPGEDKVAVYQRIDQHPRFGEFVDLIRERGRIPENENDMYFDLWYTIATDVAVQYIKDLGLLGVENLKDGAAD